MYDGIAILKKYGTPTFDAYGTAIPTIEMTEVLVQPRSVYASEFYDAAQVGLKPSIVLYMTNRADYDGQKTLEYEGREYSVIRVDWKAQRDGISLICEEKVDNG